MYDITAVDSSASVEQMFSSSDLVHFEIRNSLEVNKAAELNFLY